MIEIYMHLARTNQVIAQSMLRLEKSASKPPLPRQGQEFARDALPQFRSREILGMGDRAQPVASQRRPLNLEIAQPTPANHSWLSYDALTVELEAHRLIRREGSAAVSLARGRADAADEIGDILSAEAWRDIADEAQRILGST